MLTQKERYQELKKHPDKNTGEKFFIDATDYLRNSFENGLDIDFENELGYVIRSVKGVN